MPWHGWKLALSNAALTYDRLLKVREGEAPAEPGCVINGVRRKHQRHRDALA